MLVIKVCRRGSISVVLSAFSFAFFDFLKTISTSSSLSLFLCSIVVSAYCVSNQNLFPLFVNNFCNLAGTD